MMVVKYRVKVNVLWTRLFYGMSDQRGIHNGAFKMSASLFTLPVPILPSFVKLESKPHEYKVAFYHKVE